MAKKSGSNKTPVKQELKERQNKLFTRIVRSTNSRSKKSIQQWRSAIVSAENVDNPKRMLLYNMYNEILLDAHLTSEIERRKNALMKTPFELYDKDGKPVPEASAKLNKKWFRKLIEYAWESVFWGHSLVEIEVLTVEGMIESVRLVNRYHVIPEKGLVTIRQNDDKGIEYRENRQYAPWLFEIGDNEDLGLLNKCVPHVLFKRFAQSAYSEYCEVLGIPPRVLKTDAYDKQHLNDAEDMMANMATNTYAIIGKEDEIQFVDAGSHDGSVFVNLFRVSSNEISKLINGAVIGEDSQQGSRAKEQVSKELTDDVTESDREFIASFINEDVLPRLVEMGYPLVDLVFEFDQEKNLTEELNNALRIASQFELGDEGIEYMVKTFGVPILKQKEQPSFGGFGGFEDEGNPEAKLGNSFFD